MARRPAYRDFQAAELFCPKCKAPRPVREHLLLVLPTGNKYEYRCTACGTAVGARDDGDPTPFREVLLGHGRRRT